MDDLLPTEQLVPSEEQPSVPEPTPMETRNVLDYQGNVVGTISFPEGTSEEIWAQRLTDAATPARLVIMDVTPRQIRQALVLSGVTLEQIDTALNALPEPMKTMAKVEWEYSNSFQRNRPLVAAVGVMLGWTSGQIDALWLFAGTL